MAEVEEHPLWKYWNQFMRQAGLPRSFCLEYASSFTENDVQVNQLTEAVKKDNDWMFVFLKQVGVYKVGHVMKICTEARKLGCNLAQRDFVEFLKLDEEDETSRVGDGDNNLEGEDEHRGEDGEGTMIVEEGEDGGSTMVEDNSPPDALSQKCKHGPRENCVNCFICLKHLNTKSLSRHILDKHQLITVPVSNKKISTSSTLPQVPVAGPGGQSPDDGEEEDEDAMGIVPPIAAPHFSLDSSPSKNPSGNVQGMVGAIGKEGWELRSVEVNKRPVRRKKVVSAEQPILISLKKAVQEVQSRSQTSSLNKNPSLTVKKVKHPRWIVVESRTTSTQQVLQTKPQEKSARVNPLFRKATKTLDFVTGTSRSGRERKQKQIQSY